MEDFKDLLLFHFDKYPEMRPQDCIKLLYQNEFGGGHLIQDEDASFQFLLEVMKQEDSIETELLTPIGNQQYRLDILLANQKYSPEEIHIWFLKSTRLTKGSLTEFLKKLKEMKRHFEERNQSFTKEEWDAYLAYYRGSSYPSVHHSEEYRKRYHPHYRIIHELVLKQHGLI